MARSLPYNTKVQGNIYSRTWRRCVWWNKTSSRYSTHSVSAVGSTGLRQVLYSQEKVVKYFRSNKKIIIKEEKEEECSKSESDFLSFFSWRRSSTQDMKKRTCLMARFVALLRKTFTPVRVRVMFVCVIYITYCTGADEKEKKKGRLSENTSKYFQAFFFLTTSFLLPHSSKE